MERSKRPGEVLRPDKKTWIKSSTFILGAGIFLGVVGVSLLVGFGIGYVKPYMAVQNLKSGQCVVTLATNEEPLVTCACDAGSCHSKYPCLKTLVNMTVDAEQLPETPKPDARSDMDIPPNVISDDHDSVTIENVTLYDSYETFLLQHPARKCSFHKCDRKHKNNFNGADAFYNNYGKQVGTQFLCYFDPGQLDFAIVYVITKTTVVHAMLWPSIAVVIAMIILGLSLSEKGQDSLPHSSQRNTHSSPTFDLRYPGHRPGVEYEIIES